MHPLRKLRESGKPTAAQVSELLAENIVFNSLLMRSLRVIGFTRVLGTVLAAPVIVY